SLQRPEHNPTEQEDYHQAQCSKTENLPEKTTQKADENPPNAVESDPDPKNAKQTSEQIHQQPPQPQPDRDHHLLDALIGQPKSQLKR
ncbi:hypothetical protein, partial [Rhizobium brockwellii]|uniref:hypothetical protein n=1 Tax=Rhizobium brockwellii TaxID=3019932 RepID=UPI003F96C6E7